MFFVGISFVFVVVNINIVIVDELDVVKGIGFGKVKVIVEYCSKNGFFKLVDDLKGVKGFGEKSVVKLCGELMVFDVLFVVVKLVVKK